MRYVIVPFLCATAWCGTITVSASSNWGCLIVGPFGSIRGAYTGSHSESTTRTGTGSLSASATSTPSCNLGDSAVNTSALADAGLTPGQLSGSGSLDVSATAKAFYVPVQIVTGLASSSVTDSLVFPFVGVLEFTGTVRASEVAEGGIGVSTSFVVGTQEFQLVWPFYCGGVTSCSITQSWVFDVPFQGGAPVSYTGSAGVQARGWTDEYSAGQASMTFSYAILGVAEPSALLPVSICVVFMVAAQRGRGNATAPIS